MVKTKAERLKYLSKILKVKKIKNIKIPKLYFFTKKQFEQNSENIFFNIKKNFKKKKIIIRSSTKNEDLENITHAGKYISFNNVNVNKQEVFKYIFKIIEEFDNQNDQILIQEFIQKPDIAGVVFTRELNSDSPYYVINYDSSGVTDTITSGKFHQSIKTEYVYKEKKNYSIKFKSFLKNIEKIEKFLNCDRLDIEFAKKKNTWFVFQCRNLPRNKSKSMVDDEIKIAIKNLEKKLKKFKSENLTLSGSTTFFSNMADWNPVEMIGEKPKSLAISLYSELITDNVWSNQRKNYGYKDVAPNILMLNLAGSPFIDIRTDFNSFLPNGLKKFEEKEIINKILSYFKKNTHLHDKVEFELIPTCYDLNINNLKSIEKLNKNIKKKYIQNLKKLTKEILTNKNIISGEIKKINILIEKLKEIKKSKNHPIQKIFFITNICKKFGTSPFSGIARVAFVCTKILRSLEDIKIINYDDISNFYLGINTISQIMKQDLLKINCIKSKNYFINKYGHLRPNTYCIASLNYKEGYNIYFSNKTYPNYTKRKNIFKLNNLKIKKINYIFKKEKLGIEARDFFKLTKFVIEQREYAKFCFTKCIDEIFKNLIDLGDKMNISRKEMEFINFKTILSSYSNLNTEKLKDLLKNEIIKNIKSYSIAKKIKLPDVINDVTNIYSFDQTDSKGNFVTTHTIDGQIKYLKNINQIKNFENKIILIDNADPGFDFIFTKKIKGLITKYGGSNSHMSIRCLEQNIPAAIGIGHKKFDRLLKSNFVQLNCQKKDIFYLS